MTSQLTYKIAKLWGKPVGAVEKHEMDEKITYPQHPELNFSGNFAGNLMLIRLKEEISAIITDAEIDINFTCQRCLKPFTRKVEIPSAEREYLEEAPSVVEDPADLFLIDKKYMTIDLSDMVRQEIILHFPLIPVCSNSCKGLCPHCGSNRNKKSCDCKEEKTEPHKPFRDLKKLMDIK